MAPQTLKPRRLRLGHPGAWAVGLLLLALLIALHLMSSAVQNSESLSRAFVPLLSLVVVGIGALAVLVGLNVIKLFLSYRRQAAGSRLTGRLVILFALISLLPVGVVYYYSLGFLLRGIDSWFDVEIDTAMTDALALNQASLDLNQRVLMKYSAALLAGIDDRSTTALALTLGDLRRKAGAIELSVMEPDGLVLGSASDDPLALVPSSADHKLLARVRGGSDYVGLEPGEDGELIVRVLVRDPEGRQLLLQALFPTSARITELATRLENAYNRYTELSYLRRSLKFSFSLTLSLVLGFGLMAALLAAFRTAEALVAPVAAIAGGTRAVAAGDYEQTLPVPPRDDDLTFLVTSFNAMTRAIAQARDQASRSQQVVEEQRAYLQTVLGRLSSGVMAFDAGLAIRTMNPAAHLILGLAPEGPDQISLDALELAHPRLRNLGETLRRRIQAGADWREEVTLFGADGHQVLMCRGSPLLAAAQPGGHVLVFDDVTTLIRAQRDAAWGEVARRLAHEIKNPLTPIQLSAERLRHKLLTKLPETDARLVDRATHTIVAQVEALKAMVNDFSNYARSPQMESAPFELDALVAEVLDLYRANEVRVAPSLRARGVRVRGDSKRLRQVVHNLVKNALEAIEGRTDAQVAVSTREVDDGDGPFVELSVADDGPGVEAAMLGRLFDPYVTSKVKGTGLGLAIVKKIIEEHGGIIRVHNAEPGAVFTARLPVWHGDTGVATAPPGPAGPTGAA